MAAPSQPGVGEVRIKRLSRLWNPDGSVADGGGPAFIAASLLCADPLNISRELRLLEQAEVDLLHIDVMDGVFVPRLGFRPECVRALREATDLPIEVHLMVSQLDRHIPVFAEAGADIITIHSEACVHFPRHLALIRRSGALAGVGLSPATLPGVLTYVLDDIDLVLSMTVNPGTSGERAPPSAVRKIADIQHELGNAATRVHILVDGNVSLGNAPGLIRAGATILVCGSSSIFGQEQGVGESLRALRLALCRRMGAPSVQ